MILYNIIVVLSRTFSKCIRIAIFWLKVAGGLGQKQVVGNTILVETVNKGAVAIIDELERNFTLSISSKDRKCGGFFATRQWLPIAVE